MSPYNFVLERLSACITKIQNLDVLEDERGGRSRAIQVKSSIEKCEASKLLVTIIDRIFLCGLKKPNEGYWCIFSRFCCKDTILEFNKNTFVKTSLGKGRLWLYHSLNENILESYLMAVSYDEQLLDRYYMPIAYMKSESFRSLLVTVISGLEHVAINLKLVSCLDQYPCDIGFENHVEVDLIISDAPDVACDALELEDSIECTPSSSREVAKSWRYVGACQAREEVAVDFEPVCIQHVASKIKTKHKRHQDSVDELIVPPDTDLCLDTEVKLRRSKSGHLKRVSFHENSKRSSWSSDSNYYSMVKSSSGLSLSSVLSGCVDKNINPALTERWDPDGQEDPPLKQSHSLLNLSELVHRLDCPSRYEDLDLSADVNLVNKLNRLFLTSKQRRKTREEIAELVREYKLKFHGDVLRNKSLVPCPKSQFTAVEGTSNDPPILVPWKSCDDDHFLLKLKLEVFAFDDERTFRIYPILGEHCEGQSSKLLLVVSNRQVYIVKPLAPNKVVENEHKFYTVLCSILLDELCSIEVGLEYQNLRIHSKSENVVISTGCRCITQSLISYIYFIKNNPPNIKFRFDYHYVSMLRSLFSSCDTKSENVLYYGFVHWEDFESNWDVHSEASIKEGDLMYVISYDGSFSNKWNPCFAALKHGVFHLFNLVDLNSPSLALPLMPNVGQIGISGCRRTPESFRPHTFELVLSNSSSVLLAAANEGDVNSWIIAITESVASMGKTVITCDPLACVIIITSSTIQILQHTNWSFNHSRTVAKCTLENIIKLWYNKGVPVCRIVLSGTFNQYINDWYLFFVSEEQCTLFVDCLFWVFKNQLNKNLERQVMDPAIEDHLLDRHSKIYFTLLHAHY